MTHTASIYVHVPALNKFLVPDIIGMYISNGWNLNDYGHISLRPLGDKDDFDWIELGLDQVEKLYEIIRKKVDVNEDPAVVLMVNETEIGAVTTFFPNQGRIWFHLLINRKKHPVLPEWTDISWYIPYILNPLLVNGIGIQQIESSDDV